jgi:hypothetical protein
LKKEYKLWSTNIITRDATDTWMNQSMACMMWWIEWVVCDGVNWTNLCPHSFCGFETYQCNLTWI